MGKHRMRRLVWGVSVAGVLVACVVAGGAQPSPARWTKKENWRQRLKVGMSPQAVKNLLGEPVYEEVRPSKMVFYYQTSSRPSFPHPLQFNIAGPNEPKAYLVNDAIVVFSLPGKGKGIAKGSLSVTGWDEPAWGGIPSPPPGERPKRKVPVPCRTLAQWEVDKNWRRLSGGMDERAVERLLGAPTKKKEDAFATSVGNSAYVEWQYGTGDAKGWVKFSGPKDAPKGGLRCYDWQEPFWLVVEATLCPDPNVTGRTSE